MADALDKLLDAVEDRPSFLVFLRALQRDALKAETDNETRGASDQWQNGSVPAFLDAAVTWAEDVSKHGERGIGTRLAEESQWTFTWDCNPWQQCAKILLMGAFYE